MRDTRPVGTTGDQFFSDDLVGGDLSTGEVSESTPDMQGSADPLWCLDPANPDLMRYWEGAEADWYPDPTNPDRNRYWDGTCWTELMTPRPAPLAMLGHSAPTMLPPPPLDCTPLPRTTLRTWMSGTQRAVTHRVSSVLAWFPGSPPS